jgi:riboflavin kinase/FMN adenylyltransferase
MRVHYGINSCKEIIKPVVTVGTFDGVHYGHQKILNRLQKIAKSCNGESVLLTFDPHPRKVLFKDRKIKLINSINEKIKILDELGLDHLVIYPFSEEFSKYSADEYISELLVNKLKTNTLVIGYDHHFGRNREGNIQLLKVSNEKYSFELEEIKAHEIDEIKISSTKIRRAIDDGNIHLFKDYCGRFFEFSGKVIHGNGLGKTIGFPTANIVIGNDDKIIPSDGVYSVICRLNNETIKGIMNIGFKPSVENKNIRTIEIHLFNFDKDIYDSLINVQAVSKLRDEIKFPNLDKLKKQISNDIVHAKSILENTID